MAKKNKKQNGYVALIFAITISAVLMPLALAVQANSYLLRVNALNNEFEKVSSALAESCIDVALLRISQNYEYATAAAGDSVDVGAKTCLIKSVTYSNEENHKKTAAIVATANYRGAYRGVNKAVEIFDSAFSHDIRSSIRVIVQTVNQYGGTLQPGNFRINVAAGNPSVDSFYGASGGGTIIDIDPGVPFAITAREIAEYETSYEGCSVSDPEPGRIYSCTMINTDKPI
jgi:hypothetical protein